MNAGIFPALNYQVGGRVKVPRHPPCLLSFPMGSSKHSYCQADISTEKAKGLVPKNSWPEIWSGATEHADCAATERSSRAGSQALASHWEKHSWWFGRGIFTRKKRTTGDS